MFQFLSLNGPSEDPYREDRVLSEVLSNQGFVSLQRVESMFLLERLKCFFTCARHNRAFSRPS